MPEQTRASETPVRTRSVSYAGTERRRRPRHALIYRHDGVGHAVQRVRDVAFASIVLLFAAPVLALAALAILIENGGPVIFSQRRVGRFERLFTMYKLRTMRKSECGDALSPTSASDGRVTAVGKFLRKTSIDELPQLVNVIRGDMSLVGPRPEMPFVVHRYKRWQHLRHLAMPGMTGLWQVTCRSTVPLDHPEATALDLDYIASRSHAFDIRLIVGTVSALIRAKGAY
jgi:lipopolysaccharide/colanic/teichoic acid biosynthesis glycosyltransferase